MPSTTTLNHTLILVVYIGQRWQREIRATELVDEDVPMDEPMEVEETQIGPITEDVPMDEPMDVDETQIGPTTVDVPMDEPMDVDATIEDKGADRNQPVG
jgi:hypothetical protein